MDLSETPLDQVGASAHAHYKVAEKAASKAEEHYKSAGIYLKAAKLRVLKTRGLTWERWLKDHCPISRSRADEVIAISDGTKSQDEVREQANARDRAYKERQREERDNSRRATADRPEKSNENNERPKQTQASPEEADAVKEAEAAAKAHDKILQEVINLVRKQDTQSLHQIKEKLS